MKSLLCNNRGQRTLASERLIFRTKCGEDELKPTNRQDLTRAKRWGREVARSVALPREVTRTRTGLLYEYLFSPPCFLHCAAPCRDNELFKVAVLARYGRFPPPGPRHRRAVLRRDPSLSPRLTTSSRRNEEEGEGREERRSLRTRKEPTGPTSRPDNPRGTAVERKSLSSSRSRGRRTTNFCPLSN